MDNRNTNFLLHLKILYNSYQIPALQTPQFREAWSFLSRWIDCCPVNTNTEPYEHHFLSWQWGKLRSFGKRSFIVPLLYKITLSFPLRLSHFLFLKHHFLLRLISPGAVLVCTSRLLSSFCVFSCVNLKREWRYSCYSWLVLLYLSRERSKGVLKTNPCLAGATAREDFGIDRFLSS